MKLNSQAERLFFGNSRGKIIVREGYSVQFFFPFAIQYIEDERTLTLSAEPQIRELAWTFLLPRILRTLASTTWLEVTVEEPLYWDNSADRPLTPDIVIVERIEEVLKGMHCAHSIRKSKIRLRATEDTFLSAERTLGA